MILARTARVPATKRKVYEAKRDSAVVARDKLAGTQQSGSWLSWLPAPAAPAPPAPTEVKTKLHDLLFVLLALLAVLAASRLDACLLPRLRLLQ